VTKNEFHANFKDENNILAFLFTLNCIDCELDTSSACCWFPFPHFDTEFWWYLVWMIKTRYNCLMSDHLSERNYSFLDGYNQCKRGELESMGVCCFCILCLG
jgi:hypothetical protein